MRVYDEEEAKKINAEQWQVDLLKLNPDYTHWGNFEDYMSKDGKGWDSRQEVETIHDAWELDDYNECVNFYFTVIRPNIQCKSCEQTGLNPATLKLHKDWYSYSNTEDQEGWQYHLTQHEVDALWEAGRLQREFQTIPTAEEVNKAYLKGFGHDTINQWICVEARAERMGVYGLCETCNGSGYVYTADKAHVALQLWILHPRKGASRGLYVRRIEREDMPKAIEYLQQAAQRSAERFSAIVHYNES
jgi:hypothetical protein